MQPRPLDALIAAQRRLAESAADLDEVLQVVAEEAAAVAGPGTRSVVGLVDGDELVCRASAGRDAAAMWLGLRLPIEGSIGGLVLRTGQPQTSRDGWDDPRSVTEANRSVGVRSSVLAPLLAGKEAVGVLYATHSDPDHFDDDDVDRVVLLAMASSAAIAAAVARREHGSVRAALTESVRRLEAAREVSGAGTWEWDIATGRLAWSPEMYRIAGLEPGSVEPTIELWTSLLHPDDLDVARRRRDASVDERQGYRERFRIVDAHGRERHLVAWSEVEVGADGRPLRVVGATLDASDVEQVASTDALTGLPNRSVLDARLADALAVAGPQRQVGVLLADLDRFRLVNEALGHRTGDAVLAATAGRCITGCPAGSTLVRTDGDEFAVLLPGVADVAELEAVAGRLVALGREPYRASGVPQGTVCTMSVGVALVTDAHRDPGEVVRQAGLALHRAKAAGGDRHVTYDTAMGARAEARVRTEEALRRALDEDRLGVVYQPVVDLGSGRVVGAEALARIVDPAYGALSPALFIEVAEETGLVARLDSWVARQAVGLVRGWATEASDLGVPRVSVNLSSRSLARPEVAEELRQHLVAEDVDGGRLLVEITEHSLLDRSGCVERSLSVLRQAGVGVGIDDFGTGWSAMAYLVGLHLEFLKVDRSFVARLGEDPSAEAVVRAVVDLGHAHGMQVVGEGVETERQAQLLRELGCDQAQGWWFGRPVAARLLPDLVRTWHGRAEGVRWAPWDGRDPAPPVPLLPFSPGGRSRPGASRPPTS